MSLKPELKHNREEFDRLRPRKWQTFGAGALAIFPVVVLVPGNAVGAAAMVLLVAIVAALLSFEVKMSMVFRRDLRERREAVRRGFDGSAAVGNPGGS